MSIIDFPDYECRACKSTNWWYHPPEWVCGNCHPSPDEITRLKFRVIKGQVVMFEMWKQLVMAESEERKELQLIYKEGYDKLKRLCDELKFKGASDCLYIEDRKKLRLCLGKHSEWHCTVCPNDYWYIKEMMEHDRDKNPKDYEE